VPEEWEAAVAAAVLARQCATLDERGTRLDVVIGEAALHQQAGNTAVLSGQLCHLAALAGHHRRVTIRLLPFASRLSPAGGMGGFSVLRFGPAVDLGSSTWPARTEACSPPTRMPLSGTCGRSTTWGTRAQPGSHCPPAP
jgi:hypothetical protein